MRYIRSGSDATGNPGRWPINFGNPWSFPDSPWVCHGTVQTAGVPTWMPTQGPGSRESRVVSDSSGSDVDAITKASRWSAFRTARINRNCTRPKTNTGHINAARTEYDSRRRRRGTFSCPTHCTATKIVGARSIAVPTYTATMPIMPIATSSEIPVLPTVAGRAVMRRTG